MAATGLTLSIQINSTGNAQQVLEDVRREAAKLERQLGGVNRAAGGQATTMREVTRESRGWAQALGDTAIGKFGSKLLGIGAAFLAISAVISLAKMAFSSFIGMLKDGTEQALAFGKSLSLTANIMDSAQQKSRDYYGTISRLALEFGVNATTVSDAYRSVIAAGVQDTGVALAILTSGLKTSIAAGEPLESVMNGLIAVMQSFSKQAVTSTQIVDMFFSAANQGSISVRNISEQIGEVGGVAASLNIPLAELLGSFAQISKSETNASKAMTQLKNVISEVISPSKQFSDALRKAGVENVQMFVKTKGLLELLKRMQGVDMYKAFGVNREALSGAINLTSKLGELESTINTVKEAGASGGKVIGNSFERMSKSIGMALSQIKESGNTALRALGEAFLVAMGPAIKEVAKLVVDLAARLTYIKDESTDIGKAFKEMTTVIGKLAGELMKALTVGEKNFSTFSSWYLIIRTIIGSVAYLVVWFNNMQWAVEQITTKFSNLYAQIVNTKVAVVSLAASFTTLFDDNADDIKKNIDLYVKLNTQLEKKSTLQWKNPASEAGNITATFDKLMAELGKPTPMTPALPGEKPMPGAPIIKPPEETELSEGAKKAIKDFESLLKTTGDLRKELALIGASGYKSIEINSAARIADIRNIQKSLEKEKQLTSERKRSIGQLVALVSTITTAQIKEEDKKAGELQSTTLEKYKTLLGDVSDAKTVQLKRELDEEEKKWIEMRLPVEEFYRYRKEVETRHLEDTNKAEQEISGKMREVLKAVGMDLTVSAINQKREWAELATKYDFVAARANEIYAAIDKASKVKIDAANFDELLSRATALGDFMESDILETTKKIDATWKAAQETIADGGADIDTTWSTAWVSIRDIMSTSIDQIGDRIVALKEKGIFDEEQAMAALGRLDARFTKLWQTAKSGSNEMVQQVIDGMATASGAAINEQTELQAAVERLIKTNADGIKKIKEGQSAAIADDLDKVNEIDAQLRDMTALIGASTGQVFGQVMAKALGSKEMVKVFKEYTKTFNTNFAGFIRSIGGAFSSINAKTGTPGSEWGFNILPIFKDAAASIGSGMMALISGLGSQASIWSAVWETFNKPVVEFRKDVGKKIADLTRFIQRVMQNIPVAIVSVLKYLPQMIGNNIANMPQLFTGMVTSLFIGIGKMIPQLGMLGKKMFYGIFDGLAEGFSQIGGAIQYLWYELMNSMPTFIQELLYNPGELQKKLDDARKKWAAYGEPIMPSEDVDPLAQSKTLTVTTKRVGSDEFKVKDLEDGQADQIAKYSLAMSEKFDTSANNLQNRIYDGFDKGSKQAIINMDFGTMFSNIGKSLMTNLENMGPILGGLLALILLPFSPILAAIVLAVGLFSGLVALVVKYWDKIVTAVSDFFVGVGDIFATFFDDTFGAFGDALKAIWDGIKNFDLAAIFKGVISLLMAPFTWLIAGIKAFFAIFGLDISSFTNTLKKFIGDIVNTIAGFITSVVDFVSSIISFILAVVDFKAIGEALMKFGEWALDGLSSAYEATFGQFVPQLVAWALNLFTVQIPAAASAIGSAIAAPFIYIGDKLAGFIAGLSGFTVAFETAIGVLGGFIGSIGKFFSTTIPTVISDLFKSLYKSIPEGIKSGLKAVVDAVIGPLTTFGNWLSGLINGLIDGIKGIAGAVTSPLKKAGSWLGEVTGLWAHGGIIRAAHGWMAPLRAAGGLMVPGQASMSGDNLGNDTQPALLSPGEVVLPRSVVQNEVAMRMISAALGQSSGGLTRSAQGPAGASNLSVDAPQTINVTINVQGGGGDTKMQFERDVIPTLIKALKEQTGRGVKVINSKGVYST